MLPNDQIVVPVRPFSMHLTINCRKRQSYLRHFSVDVHQSTFLVGVLLDLLVKLTTF